MAESKHRHTGEVIEDKTRIETFSDAIYAIVATFINIYISIAIFIVTPLLYIIPHLLSNEE